MFLTTSYLLPLIVTATAVSRIDNLEFLADIVPKTKTYKQFKEEAAQREEAKKAAVSGPGPFGLPNGVNGDAGTQPPQPRTIDRQQLYCSLD